MGDIDWVRAEVDVANSARQLEAMAERWMQAREFLTVEYEVKGYPPRISLQIGVGEKTMSAEQVTDAVKFAEHLKTSLGLRLFREVDSHRQCRFTLKPIYHEAGGL